MKRGKMVYSFYKLDDGKKTFILVQFWKLEVQRQVSKKAMLLLSRTFPVSSQHLLKAISLCGCLMSIYCCKVLSLCIHFWVFLLLRTLIRLDQKTTLIQCELNSNYFLILSAKTLFSNKATFRDSKYQGFSISFWEAQFNEQI